MLVIIENGSKSFTAKLKGRKKAPEIVIIIRVKLKLREKLCFRTV